MNSNLFVVLVSSYGSIVSLGFFTSVFALYVIELGGNIAEVGIAAAIYYVLAGFLMVVFRSVMNHKKALIKWYVLGNFAEAVTALLFIAIQSIPGLYLVQALRAIATALRVPSSKALYAQYQDKGKEGSEWSIMEGGNFIIIGLGALAGGAVVYFLSFSATFIIIALVQVVSALLALRLSTKT